MQRSFRRGLGKSGSKAVACHGAILAAAIAAGAGIAKGDPIVFSNDPTADFNQLASAGLTVTSAVDGTTTPTSEGWATNGGTASPTVVKGGEGLGGAVAVFPISTTPSGLLGTNLTFDLYTLFNGQRERMGGFEIEVTTDSSTPSVNSSSVVTGTFTPVTIESVASSNSLTSFTVDPTPATALTYGDYVIAQNDNGTTEPNSPSNGLAEDIYEVTAFTTLTGITGVELISFHTLPDNGMGTAAAGEGDGAGLDQGNFVLTQITGTATPVPEPTALGFASLGALLVLRRRRRLGVEDRGKNASGPDPGNPTPPPAP